MKPTLNASWQEALQQEIKSRSVRRLAVLGIGSDLCGDDAAGSIIARRLHMAFAGRRELLALDCGCAPENCAGTLRRFRPELVLLIDAAYMEAEPGAIRGLSWQDAGGMSASTHTLPLAMLAKYLCAELGCCVFLLGIQPANTVFDTPLSPPVRAAVETVTAFISGLLPTGEVP